MQVEKKDRWSIIAPLLRAPPPSWEQLSNIICDVDLPVDFEIGRNMQVTLEQIIPEWWFQNIKEEVMAFLSWVMSSPEPLTEDPVVCFSQLMAAPKLRALMMLHQIYLLSDQTTPDWLKQFLSLDDRTWTTPSTESEEKPNLNRLLVSEVALGILFEHINQLKISDQVPLGLPVTRQQAQESQQLRLERLALQFYGLGITGRVNTDAVGLRRLYYLGKGHTKHHKHLVYTLNLDNEEGSSLKPVFQEIIVSEKLKYKVANLLDVYEAKWSFRHFDIEKRLLVDSWADQISEVEMLKHLKRQMREVRFKKKYGITKTKAITPINEIDAIVFDLVSRFLYLSNLEDPLFVKMIGMEPTEFRNRLTELVSSKILQIHYSGIVRKEFKSFVLVIQDAVEYALNLCDLILKACGSAAVIRTLDDAIIIFGSMATPNVQHMRDVIPGIRNQLDFDLHFSTIANFESYQSNFFQNLWTHSGWV